MTTKIYKTINEFWERSDRSENGVSEDFAAAHPDFEKQNLTNDACWCCSRCSDCSDCSRCSDCSDCSGCSGCSRCSDCSDCSGCSGCSRCSDCSDCSGCSRCSRCSGCSGCSRCSGCFDKIESESDAIQIPIIEGIHQKVFKAVSAEGALDMSDWHSCDTTHCRAGWVVTLAGEAGKKLEGQTSSEFAAMAIYSKSSPIKVSPVRFYETNEKALADIKRCAEEEAASK